MSTQPELLDFDLGTGVLTGQVLEGLYAVAHTFFDMDRIQEATKAFRVMVRFAPTDERSWLGLGQCHDRLGQGDIACELYGAGSVVCSPSPRLLLALARSKRELGDASAADDHFEQALGLCESIEDEALEQLVRREWGLQ